MDALQRAEITKVGIATQGRAEIAMTRDARFWRNVTIVGLIHLVLLVGLLWWSRAPSKAPKEYRLDGRRRRG